MTDQRQTIFVVAASVAAIDQITKAAAVLLWSDRNASVGGLELTVVRNPGGPFGVASGATPVWTASTLAIVVLASMAIARGRLRSLRLGTWATVAVGAILGGGIGNLIDRIVRPPGIARGAVVDWISIDPYPRVFNLADVALRASAAVVVIALIVDTLNHGRRFPPTNGAR